MARRSDANSEALPRSARSDYQVVVHRQFWADLLHWIETDRAIALRLIKLVEDVFRHPFQGLGKPEPLRGPSKAAGRAGSRKHRLLYRVEDGVITLGSARHHYTG